MRYQNAKEAEKAFYKETKAIKRAVIFLFILMFVIVIVYIVF